MSNAGILLRIIQEVLGHRNLEELQKYLKVRPEQLRGAVTSLSMLGHTSDGYVGKYRFDDIGVKLAYSKASRPRLTQIVIALFKKQQNLTQPITNASLR